MDVAILASGGKDSSYVYWWAELNGWDVRALITCVVSGDDSYMFQIPGVELAELHAEAVGVPWIPVTISGMENHEMAELESEIFTHLQERGVLHGIKALICGALRSDYQKSRIEIMCENLGIKSYTPLWHNSSLAHLDNLVNDGFAVTINSVSCDGLGKEWLGRQLDGASIEQLRELSSKFDFNIDGEGGEFETFVTAAPYLSRSIFWEGDISWEGRRGHLKLRNLGFES